MSEGREGREWTLWICPECGEQDGGGSLHFHADGCSRDGASGDVTVVVVPRAERDEALDGLRQALEREGKLAVWRNELRAENEELREALAAIEPQEIGDLGKRNPAEALRWCCCRARDTLLAIGAREFAAEDEALASGAAGQGDSG